MKHKIDCCRTDYILVVERPLGNITQCIDYGDEAEARKAYDVADGDWVCIYKQICKTTVIECRE